MKIKIGVNDSLKREVIDTEGSLLSVLEDDYYFEKKIVELSEFLSRIKKEESKYIPLNKHNVLDPLLYLDDCPSYDDYQTMIFSLCHEYEWPVEAYFSIRSLVECGYWKPMNVPPNAVKILRFGDLQKLDFTDEHSVFIEVSEDIGITNLKEYLTNKYSLISKYLLSFYGGFSNTRPGINQPNLEINKKVYKLRKQVPPVKYSEIARQLNSEYARANYTESDLRTINKNYIKTIRNLRK